MLNENIPLVNLDLSPAISLNLKYGHIHTLGDLLKVNARDLLSIKGIFLTSVLKIKEFVNGYGYHLLQEDIIDLSDLYDANRLQKIGKCRNLLEARNKIKGKSGFEYEEIALNYQIEKIIMEIKELREKAEISTYKR